MRARSFRLLLAFALTAGVALVPQTVRTQITPLAIDEGATGLGLALRQLPVEGTVLYVTAHPDDENNGVLVALNRGRGLKTSLLTVTRGDGGQNEIGPELFQAIGILRGEELAGVHKYDGADQYHTRAYEFGYSFSVEETFEKWGKDEILARRRPRDPQRAAGRHPHDEPRTAWAAGSIIRRRRGSRTRRFASRPIRRGSRNRSRKDCGRGRRARSIRPGGGPGGGGRGAAPAGGAAPGAVRRRCASRRATSIRCSACRGRSSARSRARTTSARAPASSRRSPASSGGSYALRQRAGDHARRERHPRRRGHVDPAARAVCRRARRSRCRHSPPISRPSRRPRATRSTASMRARRTRRCPRSRAGLARVRQLRAGGRRQHAVGRPESRDRLAARSQGAGFHEGAAARAGARRARASPTTATSCAARRSTWPCRSSTPAPSR